MYPSTMRSIPCSRWVPVLMMTTILLFMTIRMNHIFEYCDAATSFFPQTSFSQQTGSSEDTAKKKKKKTMTQRNIATTGPHTTPVGFWSPHLELFIPRQPTSNQKNDDLNSKYSLQSSTIGVFHSDWVTQLQNQHWTTPNIRIESLQFIFERFTSDVIQPMWNTALSAVEEQVLVHVYNNAETTAEISSISSPHVEEVVGVVDPGDFLGETNGWSAYFDRANTCLIYYFHQGTGVSQWIVPYLNYPIPTLNHQQLQMMEQKISQHQQQRQLAMSNSGNDDSKNTPHLASNIFQGIQDMMNRRGSSNNNEQEPEKNKPDDKPWWSTILDVVFENQSNQGDDDTQQGILVDDKNRNAISATTANDQVPFFASIANGDSSNMVDKVLGVSSTTKPAITAEQSFDIVTTLSPWWDLLRDVVVKAATTAMESQSTNVEAVQSTVDIPIVPQNVNQQPWEYFFPSKMEKKEKTQSTSILKSQSKEQSRSQLTSKGPTSEGDNNKNVIGWMSDLPLFLTRDVSRTTPLFGLFPKKSNDNSKNNKEVIVSTQPVLTTPLSKEIGSKQPTHAERLKVIEEKRYAASRARQANLRKTYGTIIHDRSPTVSLTSIKLRKSKSTSNDNIDWYKYLDD